jgi:uncharacterized protein
MNFIRKHFRTLSLVSLGLVIAITTLSIIELRKNIRFDYDFESFFPVNDPDLDVYLQFRQTFEYDNEFVLLAIESKEGIFRKDFLSDIQSLTDSLRTIPDVTSVTSPTDLTYFTTTGSYPYIHIDEPARYASDSALIYKSKELIGSFFPPDAKSVSLYIKTTEGISKEKSDRILERLQLEVNRYAFDKVHLASKLNGQKVYLDRLQHEFVIFFIASFFLIVTFLYISFRSFWGVWIPIVIVLLAITWTLGLMTATGKSLDIMTVLLPTMMFVVGMSDVVHIVTKYLEEMRSGAVSRFDALIKTIREVGFATFITLVTTGLGFLTLLNSRIIPIRDFGLYTSIGVFIAFILAFTIMPIALNLIKQPNLRLEKQSSQFWSRRLLRLLSWIFRNRKMIGVSTIIITLLSCWGISRISLNNYLIEGLTTRDELREDFVFFENSYSGVRPFELVVRPADSARTLLGVKELQAMNRLEAYLEKDYGVGFIISPVTFIKGVNKTLHDGNPDFFVLPSDSADVEELVNELGNKRKRKEFLVFLTKDAKEGRISGKMHDIGSKNIRVKDKNLDSFLARPDMQTLHVQHTGAAVMLDKNNEYLVANTLQGLLISIFVVALIIGLIHRSWRMALVAVIPNFLPIIIIGGLMGFAGIELKSSTSIIFSIAFGIATDDTIHFLGRLKLEMKQGRTLLYAVKRTFISTGKAVVVTSLILSAGFMTLITSSFESTFYFGLLVSITLLIAVMTDLLLFPLLVFWLFKQKKEVSRLKFHACPTK